MRISTAKREIFTEYHSLLSELAKQADAMFDFLEIEDVLDLHDESLKRYGGATGLREPGLLDSALASAINGFL